MRVGIIGTGEMGSGIGEWLAAHGADVYTNVGGRSAASVERVRRAGIAAVDNMHALASTCTIVLSIVPPDKAVGVAEAFAKARDDETVTSLFADCNAIAPETSRAIGAIVASARLSYVDAGIIGGPPAEGYDGPRIYACGPDVATFTALNDHGLHIVPIEGEIGRASALKMCYGGMTKGITGIGAAMFACAERAGVASLLAEEFASSQTALNTYLTRQIPGMYPKAYRWVPEMREIASFGSDEPGVAEMYEGLAERYKAIAAARAAEAIAEAPAAKTMR